MDESSDFGARIGADEGCDSKHRPVLARRILGVRIGSTKAAIDRSVDCGEETNRAVSGARIELMAAAIDASVDLG
jgi:hypothetical protein